MKLNVGDIYEIDTRNAPGPFRPYGGIVMTVRVLAFDNYQVFDDHKYETESEWECDKAYTKAYRFTRTPIGIFETYGKWVDHEEIPQRVLEVVRPDLPLAIARIQGLSWHDDCFSAPDKLHAYICQNTDEQWQQETINIPSFYLEPVTPQKMPKKAVLIEADNGKYFTAEELLWKAKSIRDTVNKAPSEGVGIFRGGLRKQLPTYYIWDYCSLSKSYCAEK